MKKTNKIWLVALMTFALNLNVRIARADAGAFAPLGYLLAPILGPMLNPLFVRAGWTPQFVNLFNGVDLGSWSYCGDKRGEFFVTNGVLVCPPKSTGTLISQWACSDFTLAFEYKLEAGANGGIAIRGRASGDNLTDSGVEIALVDDKSPLHSHLKPSQRNGSIYGIVAAKHGTPKIGKWNRMAITCVGRKYRIVLNDDEILNADFNDIRDADILGGHPGILRVTGNLALVGHSGQIEYRNIYVLEFPRRERHNKPPRGFKALFNGKNLKGWKGLVKDPPAREKMTKKELAAEQGKVDKEMPEHWKVKDGELVFDGKGQGLSTKKDYGDFELQVDWKIAEKGNSGIYLRGSPAVQIWETNSPGQFTPPDGSGGLYNNQKESRRPLKYADEPAGYWNQFRILVVGEKVHVFLNNELVVNNETLENYWERDKPIYLTGPIGLQTHGERLCFRDVYIREIPRK